jgi:hypothetical protein
MSYRYVLKLEAIGDNVRAQLKSLCAHLDSLAPGAGGSSLKGLSPWVARIHGQDPQFGFTREFIRGQKDYSAANSIGSRDVWLFWFLEPGVYEIYARESWNSSRRYFLHINAKGEAREITKKELLELLT